MSAVEQQLELGIPARVDTVEVDEGVIKRLPSRLHALRYCITASGLSDKQIYDPLGIDKGQWSRIVSGSAHFPTDKYDELQRLCGNWAVLLWDANRAGFDLEPQRSSLERRLAEVEAENAQLKAEKETIVAFVKQTRPSA